MTNSQYSPYVPFSDFSDCTNMEQYQDLFELDSPPDLFRHVDRRHSWTQNEFPSNFVSNYNNMDHGFSEIARESIDSNNNYMLNDATSIHCNLNYTANNCTHNSGTSGYTNYYAPQGDSNQFVERCATDQFYGNATTTRSCGSVDNNCDAFPMHVPNDANFDEGRRAGQELRPHSDSYSTQLNTPKKRGRKPLKQTEEERELKRKFSNRLSQKKARDRREREKEDMKIENEKLRLELDIANRQIHQLQSKLRRTT